MSNVKDKLKDAGHAVAEAAKAVGEKAVEGAKHVGHKVAEGAGNAVDFVKDKTGIGHAKDQGMAAIKEHMPVYASCGTKIGTVDRVEDGKIKLAAKDSKDGQHHYLPISLVDRVDTHVHLNKNSVECESEMKSGSCGSGSSSCGAMPS
jgi:hypothetical protein